jgi:predicted HTH transcriptional regulator
MAYTEQLVRNLLAESTENEWLEVKHNQEDPEEIGKYISALANSATLKERKQGYLIWGVDDKTHEILGTTFNPRLSKIGGEELENWLRKLLKGYASFSFEQLMIDGRPIVLLTVDKAVYTTVKFKNTEYVRIGSYLKHLKDFPAVEVQIWNRLTNTRFEELHILTDLQEEDLFQLLDTQAYFRMLQIRMPSENPSILHYLKEEQIIALQENGRYAITSLGALLFARNLNEFRNLSRKCVRVIRYKDTSKMTILNDFSVKAGYASGFEDLFQLITTMIPGEEVLQGGIRRRVTAYPLSTVRELIANALIHQDLIQTGTGPLVEIFSNRCEITNPGCSLVDINRIVDNPPKSRNEKIASLMRRLGICEELGSGWDRIVLDSEAYKLPAPKIIEYEESTRVTVYAAIAFPDIGYAEKLRACYLHATIRFINEGYLTNTSLRDRFGLTQSHAAMVSRLIRDAVNQGLIKPLDPTTAPRYMKYVPYWA